MKLSSRIAELKSRKPAKQPEPGLGKRPGGPFGLPRWVFLALCLLLAGGATWAFCEFVLWNKIPSELVGKWVVTEGPDKGSTIDFDRNGTMVTKITTAGLQGIHEIEARIRVRGKKIHATITNELTGEEGTRVQTIKALEENHLVLEDEHGRSVRLERDK